MTKMKPVFDAFIRNGAGMFIATRLAPSERDHAQLYYEFMRPTNGSVVVDLGCGTGECGALLQEIDPSLTVVNVVNDGALIAYMRNLGRLCVESSFEKTPLDDEVADFVMINEAIGHGDLDAVLSEAWRLLKDGGVVTIKDFSITDQTKFNLPLSGWSYKARQPAEFVSAAYRNGFSVDALIHPPMYMKHWYEIMDADDAANASALIHDPRQLPLCTALYRLVKGNLNGRRVD